MTFQIAERQAENYLISTDIYEGPLDLLLQLIERAELDITRLALAQVTDQYLAYLRAIRDRSAAEVSAFLVIAARLVQIKSAALLPRPPAETGDSQEEDPGEALARQLIVYKRFKELGSHLEDRHNRGLHTFLRVAPPPVKSTHAQVDLSGLSLDDLVAAARSIFRQQARLPELSQVVAMPRITIRERIRAIMGRLREFRAASFHSLLSTTPNRVEVVVTFLAMLELIKQHVIEARQVSLFGEIELEQSGGLLADSEIAIEFEE